MQARQADMQGRFYLLLFILFFITTTVPAGEAPDLYKNQLQLWIWNKLQVQWQAVSQLGQSLGCS